MEPRTGLRITPLEIRNHGFRRRITGYDPSEIDAFLQMVADDYENTLQELQQIRETVAKLDSRVVELAANEALVKDTLATAQKLSEELRQTATRESEVRIGEAEIESGKILEAAHRKAARLTEDIREMRSLRSSAASAVRATLEPHLRMLSNLEEDEGSGAEDLPLSQLSTETDDQN